MTDWFTVKEAVGILGMSERTIRRYVAEGKLLSRLENGRRLVYVKGHDNGMPPDTPNNFDLLFQEQAARIQQLQEQVEQLKEQLSEKDEQISELHQLLAISQKNVDRVTEQNQLLLEDLHPKQRWYHRLLVWNNA